MIYCHCGKDFSKNCLLLLIFYKYIQEFLDRFHFIYLFFFLLTDRTVFLFCKKIFSSLSNIQENSMCDSK